MKNRYEFIKNIYKDYVIFIIKKDKYYTFNNDKLICDIYNINIENIDKKEINYITLDNLDIIKINKDDNNKYYEYLIKSIIISLVRTNTLLYK